MPIYEFYCSDCHTIYGFLSRTVDTGKRPPCPRCGRADLERRASAFAISKGREESDEGLPEGLDASRLERAMESLAGEAGALEGDDPRAAARFVRRLYDTAGLPVSGELREALHRMESGEDPDAIEEEMGGLLESLDPFGGAAAERPGASVRRRFLPPRRDPELHEM